VSIELSVVERRIAADSGGTIKVDNPANGEIVGSVPNMGAGETKRAIEQANAALPAWRVRTAKERSAILRKWFDLMMANQDCRSHQGLRCDRRASRSNEWADTSIT
jgi:acyl-CoA reductase-like NAD-dependent aldehyde dehydrogenase